MNTLYVNTKGEATRFIRSRACVGPVFSRFADGTLVFSAGISAGEIAGMAPIMYEQPQIERGRHDT